jgi:Spy/CpxP family protein refolding chaperone
MDWIKQRTFQNWVIGLLVALNLLALTIVWIQSSGQEPAPAREPRKPGGVSVALLQRELNLTADQVAQYNRLRAEQMEAIRVCNDELDSLKLRLADMVFDPPSGRVEAESTAARIGLLQSQLEILRFRHFSALAEICNEQQKERLRPILREVLGRKGPGEKPAPGSGPEGVRPPEPQPEREGSHEAVRQRGETQPPRGEERRGPPSLEEKVSRYVQRLSLTAEQAAGVEEIFKTTRASEEAFRSQGHPTEEEFEREKERLRTREDQSVLKILNADQKAEFEKMMRNRRNPPPRN